MNEGHLRNELLQFALKLRTKAENLWQKFPSQSANCAKLAFESCADEIEEIATANTLASREAVSPTLSINASTPLVSGTAGDSGK